MNVLKIAKAHAVRAYDRGHEMHSTVGRNTDPSIGSASFQVPFDVVHASLAFREMQCRGSPKQKAARSLADNRCVAYPRCIRTRGIEFDQIQRGSAWGPCRYTLMSKRHLYSCPPWRPALIFCFLKRLRTRRRHRGTQLRIMTATTNKDQSSV